MQSTTPLCNLTGSQSTWLGTGVLSQWLRILTSRTRSGKQIFHYDNLYIITSVLSGKLIHNLSGVCPISKFSITDHWRGRWNDLPFFFFSFLRTLCSCYTCIGPNGFWLFATILWKHQGHDLLLEKSHCSSELRGQPITKTSEQARVAQWWTMIWSQTMCGPVKQSFDILKTIDKFMACSR